MSCSVLGEDGPWSVRGSCGLSCFVLVLAVRMVPGSWEYPAKPSARPACAEQALSVPQEDPSPAHPPHAARNPGTVLRLLSRHAMGGFGSTRSCTSTP